MKVFFRNIHLYLSLAAGLVILVCCFTGAILVFEKDLMMMMHKNRYYVQPEGEALSIDTLVQHVKSNFPAAKVNSVKIYADKKRSVEINVAFPGKNKEAKPVAKKETTVKEEKKSAPQRQPGFTIFVDPYTGRIIEKYSYRESGFYTVFALHRWLLGDDKSIGKYIVGISTLIFLFILITGIILWWPRNKRILQQRLKIKSNAGWKRINHDLHMVFGFYSAIFLFIFAFTGLAWSFEWFNDGIYKVANSPLKPPPLPKSVYQPTAKTISFDEAIKAAKTVHAQTEFYNLACPKDSLEVFAVSSLPTNAMHESATDAVYIDQYSGKILKQLDYGDKSTGARVRSMFKPVHTGSIWGLPSKIIAFIVCLMGVTFPITGVIMWINRLKKKKLRQ